MSLQPPPPRRKKNDDISHFYANSLTPASGLKRTASGTLDGHHTEGVRKRKRMDPPAMSGLSNGISKLDGERPFLVDFQNLPPSVIYRYLTQFELIPLIYPSPLGAEDPAPPYVLTDPLRYLSRLPTPPPPTSGGSNRSQQPPQQQQPRQLILDPEFSRPPISADVSELHHVLSSIAERHFRDVVNITGREEVESLAAFMCTIEKIKNAKNTYVRSDRAH